MPSYCVEIQVAESQAGQVDEERLRQAAIAVLTAENQPDGAELTLVITGDAEIQALNRDYRDTDAPTDVLSFPVQEGEPFVLPEGEGGYLGDVIISLPTAAAQAVEQGHPVERELALLVVHGCLHLIGYDHAEEAEQECMWARQDAILAALQPPG